MVKPFRKEPPEKSLVPSSGPSSTTPESPAPQAVDIPVAKQSSSQQITWRLFGAYMNSFVVYADAQSAWLMTDDFYGKLSSSLYQRISSGQHMGGIKLVRGYSEPSKFTPEKKTDFSSSVSRPVTPSPESKALRAEVDASHKRKSMPPPSIPQVVPPPTEGIVGDRLDPRSALQRHLSAYGGKPLEENQILEDEMKEDYKNLDDDKSEDQGREIEYLLLTTHG